jgi:hypothetical protein
MLLRQRYQTVVDFSPHFMAGDRPELLIGHFNLQLHRAAVPHIHDGALGRAVRRDAVGAHKQAGDLLDRLLGGTQADALQSSSGEQVEPLQG